MPLINLEAQPVVETPFGRWSPLNEPLELKAFGVNSIVCDPFFSESSKTTVTASSASIASPTIACSTLTSVSSPARYHPSRFGPPVPLV